MTKTSLQTKGKSKTTLPSSVSPTWRTVRLGDVADVIRGVSFGAGEGHLKPFKGGIPVLRANNVKEDGILDLSDLMYVNPSKISGDQQLRKNDIVVVASSGSKKLVGKNTRIVSAEQPLSFGAFMYVVRPKVIEPRYLGLFFKSLIYRNQLHQVVDGTNINNLRRTDLANIQFLLPTRTEDEVRVADTLSAFDEKIDNNNHIIKTLEEMAQAIFKEWFGNSSSDDENKENLFDVLSVTYGHPFKSVLFNEVKNGLPVIRIRNILDGQTSTYTPEKVDEKYIVNDGDILVGMDGQFHLRMWSSGAALLNQRVVRFRPKEGKGWFFAYLSLQKPIKQKELSAVGTTVGHLSDKDLKSIFFPIPEDSLKKKFDELTDTYYWQIVGLLKENQKLASMRDLLLPRLMSGEIGV